jgi:hypothetical protein
MPKYINTKHLSGANFAVRDNDRVFKKTGRVISPRKAAAARSPHQPNKSLVITEPELKNVMYVSTCSAAELGEKQLPVGGNLLIPPTETEFQLKFAGDQHQDTANLLLGTCTVMLSVNSTNNLVFDQLATGSGPHEFVSYPSTITYTDCSNKEWLITFAAKGSFILTGREVSAETHTGWAAEDMLGIHTVTRNVVNSAQLNDWINVNPHECWQLIDSFSYQPGNETYTGAVYTTQAACQNAMPAPTTSCPSTYAEPSLVLSGGLGHNHSVDACFSTSCPAWHHGGHHYLSWLHTTLSGWGADIYGVADDVNFTLSVIDKNTYHPTFNSSWYENYTGENIGALSVAISANTMSISGNPATGLFYKQTSPGVYAPGWAFDNLVICAGCGSANAVSLVLAISGQPLSTHMPIDWTTGLDAAGNQALYCINFTGENREWTLGKYTP